MKTKKIVENAVGKKASINFVRFYSIAKKIKKPQYNFNKYKNVKITVSVPQGLYVNYQCFSVIPPKDAILSAMYSIFGRAKTNNPDYDIKVSVNR